MTKFIKNLSIENILQTAKISHNLVQTLNLGLILISL